MVGVEAVEDGVPVEAGAGVRYAEFHDIADGQIFVQAGAGVVADSDPAAEYAETLAKARAPMKAAEDAWRFTATTRGQGADGSV